MTDLSTATTDELRAELERRDTEERYLEAAQAFDRADHVMYGLIAAWPLMPETVALQERLAKAEGGPVTDPDGWITHNGGPCPVSRNTTVQIIDRSGYESGGEYAAAWIDGSDDWWQWQGAKGDNIIKYRVVKPD